MKHILFSICLLSNITIFAQLRSNRVNSTESIPAKPQVVIPNKTVITSTLPVKPNYTEGKDLIIKIDRIDDKSTIDLNQYTVNYTVTNWGTQDLNLGYYITVVGTFKNNDGSYFCPGGEKALPQDQNRTLRSGETISGTMDITAPKLKTNVTYKYVLEIDGKKHITEGNEANNTAETLITGRAIKDADYFLSSVKLTIKTGNDNKEANNSLVYFYFGPANSNESSFFGIGTWYEKTGYAPEIKANTTTEINLPIRVTNQGDRNSLCFYKQKGIALTIIYDNKTWKSDAWKIDNISITLEFKDRNGNPYPTPAYANKTINLQNSGCILGYKFGDDLLNNANQIRLVTMGTDANFAPLNPSFATLGPNNRFSTLTLTHSSTYNKPTIYCD